MPTPRDIPRLLGRGIALHAGLALVGMSFGTGFGWLVSSRDGRYPSNGEPLFFIGAALVIGVPVLVMEFANARRLRLAATTHVATVLDRCRGCGYDLIGGERQGKCPECGAAYIFANDVEITGGATPVATPPLSRQLVVWRHRAWTIAMLAAFGFGLFLGAIDEHALFGFGTGAIGATVLVVVLGVLDYHRLTRIARAYATRPLGECMNCGRDLTDRVRDGRCETCGERLTVRSRGA